MSKETEIRTFRITSLISGDTYNVVMCDRLLGDELSLEEYPLSAEEKSMLCPTEIVELG
jgi:hypothetical protein